MYSRSNHLLLIDAVAARQALNRRREHRRQLRRGQRCVQCGDGSGNFNSDLRDGLTKAVGRSATRQRSVGRHQGASASDRLSVFDGPKLDTLKRLLDWRLFTADKRQS